MNSLIISRAFMLFRKRSASELALAVLALSSVLTQLNGQAATHLVDANSANPLPPFTNWSTAAQDIQSAVDAAVDGDTVLVTNGIYASGGRAVYGTMTNRVAIDRAITVQSVNGPGATLIRGAYAPGGTNGDGAVRCAYLTNGAALIGFTLTNGATLRVDLFAEPEREASGGGALCAGATAVVSNCVFTGNLANWAGGGARGGTLSNRRLFGNTALKPISTEGGGRGGGAYDSTLAGCILTSNLSYQGGGAVYSTLINCALTNNAANDYGGGAASCTLTNCSLTGNSATHHGGGAPSSTLLNCTLTRNLAHGTYTGGGGGGAWSSALTNCLFQTNYATAGGGASACTLDLCTLARNSAQYGGGVFGGMSYRSTFTGNFVPLQDFAAGQSGGGAVSAVLVSCRFIGNSAFYGGGSYYSTLTNCVVTANLARWGGGAWGGTLNGCTVASNSADYGGGIGDAPATNCIIYFNHATLAGSNYYYYGNVVVPISFCCTAPTPYGGYVNIVNDPALVDYASCDLHLRSNSPCINSGNNAYVATAVDFDGNIRIVGGTVDIGAYEFQGTGSVISYAWLQQYGLPTDGSADFADADGDGMSNYGEWSSDTNPTNAQSALKMVSVARVANTVEVTWESVSTRNYTLEWAFGLNPPQFHQVWSSIAGKPGLTTITQYFMGFPPIGPTFYRVSAQKKGETVLP